VSFGGTPPEPHARHLSSGLEAARILGLGATLTTLYLQFEKEAEAVLGSPQNVDSYALLPIGYPMGRFGPVRKELGLANPPTN
jgi:hypothetical protein